MEQSLTIVTRARGPVGDQADIESSSAANQLNKVSKRGSRRRFNRKRARVNVVYALLIASIFFTIVSAATTCARMRETEQGGLRQGPATFNVIRLCSFTLLAVTCSLALTTIIKKDRNNGRLLARLKSINRDLQHDVQKRTKELSQAIKAKEHFLAIASHDLKAPINGILGLVELLKMENNNSSANGSEYLAHIEYSCNKMQGLISDILEINRIEQGRAVFKRQQVDLFSFLRKIKYDFSQQAARKSIDLLFIEEFDGKVETDPDSLSRILENLLSNAIKFSPSHTVVTLRSHCDNESLIFEVSDQGPGIPRDEQPKLFNKFERLSNRPTNFETSTGLGLSIVKELTIQLGGRVSFTSEVGKGSTFIVRLPIRPAEKK